MATTKRTARTSNLGRLTLPPDGKEFTAKFSGVVQSTSSEAATRLEAWARSQPQVAAPKNAPFQVQMQPLSNKALNTLTDILHSESPPARMVELNVPIETFIGTLVTALAILRYTEEKAAFEKSTESRTRGGQEKFDKGTLEFLSLCAQAGMELNDRGLVQQATLLTSNDDALSLVLQISKTAQETAALGKSLVALIHPAVASPVLLPATLTPYKICKPITGVFTKHFAHTYQWTVSLPYFCGTWWKWKWCWQTVVIATVTVNLDLNIGYNIVNCCYVTVWGTASGSVCAGSYCLNCSAALTGAATIAASSSGGQCNYSIGISAAFSCKIGSTTLFSVNYPIGWNVSGPCPPIPC